MIFQISGSEGREYLVDSEEVTCTCPDFLYRRSSNMKYSVNRLCKHLIKIYSNHPEVKPLKVPLINESSNSRDEYPILPREIVSVYVGMSIEALRRYGSNIKFCQVGDYVIEKPEISDGVRFLISVDGSFEKLSKFLNGVTFSDEIFISERKSDFSINGMIHLQIVNVPENELYTRSLFNNSGKKEVLRLIKSAYSLGYELSLHGLIGSNGEYLKLESEEDIYRKLGEEYKLPRDRWSS